MNIYEVTAWFLVGISIVANGHVTNSAEVLFFFVSSPLFPMV